MNDNNNIKNVQLEILIKQSIKINPQTNSKLNQTNFFDARKQKNPKEMKMVLKSNSDFDNIIKNIKN